MRRTDGIRRKMWVMFVLQLAAISFATILGVYGAATVLEDVLIKQALTEEAAHYWHRVQANPQARPPNTANLCGFLQPSGRGVDVLPPYLRGFTLGYHPLQRPGGHDLVYVSDWPNGRLFLVFKQEQVDRLAFFFGFAPLTVVLLIIYITLYFTYRASRLAPRAVAGDRPGGRGARARSAASRASVALHPSTCLRMPTATCWCWPVRCTASPAATSSSSSASATSPATPATSCAAR